MKRKIIFLDFDGVITTEKSKYKLDKERLDIFKTLLDRTDAEIVISSSWRRNNLEDTIRFITKRSHFVPFPFPFCHKVIGITKRLPSRFRGEEIDLYIKENLEGQDFNYVILDDDSDMLKKQKKNFVNTHWGLGINEEDVEKAIKILNKEEWELS